MLKIRSAIAAITARCHAPQAKVEGRKNENIEVLFVNNKSIVSDYYALQCLHNMFLAHISKRQICAKKTDQFELTVKCLRHRNFKGYKSKQFT